MVRTCKGCCIVVSLAALVVLRPGPVPAGEGEAARKERVKLVRATYQSVPPTILQIKEPIRVAQCAHQKVPVVIGLMFTDADGTTHDFSWWLDKGKFTNAEYDRIYWLHYKGPSSIGAKKFRLPVRGPEEDALYGLLLRWAAAKEKEKDLGLFDKEMLKLVNSLLEKLDERFAAEKPVLQK